VYSQPTGWARDQDPPRLSEGRAAINELSKLFELNPQGFELRRGLRILAVLMVPLVVLAAIGQEEFWVGVSFGALLVVLSDPGGEYSVRVQHMAVFALIGGLLTGLGFVVGRDAWWLAVLASFAITLVAGLTVKFGLHRFAAGSLLNIWFVVVLSLPSAFDLARIQTTAASQTLAWLIGAAIAIGYTGAWWLVRGRTAQAQPVPELIPGSTAPVELTRHVILFAVIRALALSVSVAIAFGLHVENADWMPIATIVAMKPSLQQSALIAEQRVIGTILGAALAALVLLTVANRYVLEVVIVVLGALAGMILTVNYVIYTIVVAGFVLIASDLGHPSDLSSEGRRVLFTLLGVGIAVFVMFLAGQLQKSAATRAPQAT